MTHLKGKKIYITNFFSEPVLTLRPKMKNGNTGRPIAKICWHQKKKTKKKTKF